MLKLTSIRLRKELKQLDKDLLIKEVLQLFSNFKNVQGYYQMRFMSPGRQAILDSYKEKIQNEYFPDRGFGKARNSISRNLISEYK